MKKIYLSLLMMTFCLYAFSQKQNRGYLDYIEKYKGIAVSQMQRYKIPASITLAQGLLESGAGKSTLATKSNNHFGIKCGRSWQGMTVRHTDDAPDECFRAYKHAAESYEDHSIFLSTGRRYAFLFDLSISDYRSWAKGLKKAGYATDPSYANKLISIIENYELYRFDSKKLVKRVVKGKTLYEEEKEKEYVPINRDVYLCNDIAYVVAKDGDSFKNISKDMGISSKKLVKYNNLHNGYNLQKGDRIYLAKKKTRYSGDSAFYIVKEGDSMHSISQKYGITLKSLYKMNYKKPDYIAEVGHRLRLR